MVVRDITRNDTCECEPNGAAEYFFSHFPMTLVRFQCVVLRAPQAWQLPPAPLLN